MSQIGGRRCLLIEMVTKSAIGNNPAGPSFGDVPQDDRGPTQALKSVVDPVYGFGVSSMVSERLRDVSVSSPAGTPMGFESAFECHWAEVSSVVARLVGDVDVARDIAQDTFVQLLRRPPSAETPLRPWLVRVAINRAYNELRANRRRYEREAREFRERHASNEPSSEAASANLIAERELVRQTLLELPERSREILGLRAEGFSYLDIASAMQISPGSVGTLLARAERAFRLSYEARRGGM